MPVIDNITIENFKSIRSMRIEDCRRINVLIGYPNVGKSNILEALGLFSLPYLEFNNNKSINQLIRLKEPNELFYNVDTSKNIEITVNRKQGQHKETVIVRDDNGVLFIDTSIFISQRQYEYHCKVDSHLHVILRDEYNMTRVKHINEIFQIKKYHFANIEKQEAGHHVPFLIPPNHSNLYKLITTQPELLESIAFELKKIGGEYLYDQKSKISSVLKKVSDSYQFTLPFDSLADTLRRLLFYRTAVLTNKESVILFEEPETHFFPPYISGLMHDIISDRESGNQYFISSHSPYILNDLIENPNLNSELSIYAVSYKDSQTMIRRITDEQIEQIYQNGIDMFFNLDRFLDDED